MSTEKFIWVWIYTEYRKIRFCVFMCLRPVLPPCEITYFRYSCQSLKYTSYTRAAINWPSENTVLGSSINLNRITKTQWQWETFILSSVLAKLGRKNKLFKFVLELKDLGCYRPPWAGAPSTCDKSVLWTASISFRSIPEQPKQAVWAGGSFDSLGRIQAMKFVTTINTWIDLRPSPTQHGLAVG